MTMSADDAAKFRIERGTLSVDSGGKDKHVENLYIRDGDFVRLVHTVVDERISRADLTQEFGRDTLTVVICQSDGVLRTEVIPLAANAS